MAIKVSQAFERTSANPIDETLALTKAQMKAVNDNLMPAKYVTICQDDGKLYLYDKSATPSATTGKFKKFEGSSANLPSGGTTGQALVKKSNTDGDVEWKAVSGLPTGGTSNQQLVKNSSTDGDASWKTVYNVPTGGTTGQVLAKNSNTDGATTWKTIKEAHTIKDTDGNDMTHETNLQFEGLKVTDDATNKITKVAGEGLNDDSLDDITSSTIPGAMLIGNPFNYSLNEQMVGRWIDGKPLYQKVITGNAPLSTSAWTTIASLGNTCNIRRAEIYVESSLGLAPVPFGMSNVRCFYNFSNGAYSIGDISMNLGDASSTSWTNQPLYVIVQYTKTTD